MAYDSYLVQETDGSSRFTLEDGSGSLILETAVEVAAATGTRPAGAYPALNPVINSDDELIMFVLSLN